MSADRIIYCLERVSDYRDFERLCSALLAGTDYLGIDPLGGTGDGGRDAIIRVDRGGRRIVFAYTVREDWRVKLKGDCARVHDMEHNPDVFVFVCTETLNASDKDFAHEMVKKQFGWSLDLYDIERLRVQLVGPQRHLIAQHPSIFTPLFFPQLGGQSLSESKDTVLIDHADADHALATWLSRRLTLQGYRTWCRGTAPLAGENPDETVRKLMEFRAVQYLPVISEGSLSDQLFLERCALAAAKDGFVLPCSNVHGHQQRLPSRLRTVASANFCESWKDGVNQVLGRFATLGLKPGLESVQGRQIALRDYLPTRVTVAKPEPVYANLFPLSLPDSMLIYDLARTLTEDETLDLRSRWAFVELTKYRLVAFTPPPKDAIPEVRREPTRASGGREPRTPEFAWAELKNKDGKSTTDVAKELAWRSLQVICVQRGLKHCPDRNVFYFGERADGEWNQPFTHVDGRQTRVRLTGTRTKGWGDHASQFLYQLAPKFRPQHDVDGSWNVNLSIYVRCTDMDGKVYELKEIGRRRKVVTKSWWNKDWLARLLGAVQALETSEGQLQVGEGSRAVVMKSTPLTWMCPVGLDVQALAGIVDLGEEMAEYRTREEEVPDAEAGAPAAAAVETK